MYNLVISNLIKIKNYSIEIISMSSTLNLIHTKSVIALMYIVEFLIFMSKISCLVNIRYYIRTV